MLIENLIRVIKVAAEFALEYVLSLLERRKLHTVLLLVATSLSSRKSRNFIVHPCELGIQICE